MTKYLIQHDRENCIGCESCTKICPQFWEMADDSRSDLKGAQDLPEGWQKLEIEENDFACNFEAAKECPVNVIHLENLDKGKKLI
jgi:ferredoxin